MHELLQTQVFRNSEARLTVTSQLDVVYASPPITFLTSQRKVEE